MAAAPAAIDPSGRFSPNSRREKTIRKCCANESVAAREDLAVLWIVRGSALYANSRVSRDMNIYSEEGVQEDAGPPITSGHFICPARRLFYLFPEREARARRAGVQQFFSLSPLASSSVQCFKGIYKVK